MIERQRIALIFAVALVTVTGTLSLLILLDGPGRPARAFPDTLYVALDGDDTGDCSEEINPCRTVQYAVDHSPTDGEIRVATGIYTGVEVRDGNTQVVYISKTVAIRGGYTISDWSQADPDANPTTLDAEGQGRVVHVTGDIGFAMEGLRITGGDAASGGGSSYGGGVNIEYAMVTISGCRVYSNTATRGGGLYLYQSSSTLDANVVTANTATGTDVYDGGGGLYMRNGGATLRGNTIVSNATGGRGGGIHLYNSGATVSGNRIMGNMAGTRGGGVYLFESGAATLVGNTVSGNATAGRGGGVSLSYSGATLSGNAVVSNTAGGDSVHDGGGGLYLYQSDDAVLVGNTFVSNVAVHEGGGMYLNRSVVVLENNIVADNQANARGSGMYVYGSDSRLLHTTIARNNAGDGSGVHIAYSEGVHSDLVLTNTILVSHTVGVTVAERNSVRLEGTLWGGGMWGNAVDWGGDGVISTGTSNIWDEPGFVNPADDDYHITMGSAARDAGVDTAITADIDGEPRPYCYRHDIGADEFWPSIPARIEILGPVSGAVDVPYKFIAIVEPPTATLPVSYTWSATGQISTVRTGGISDTAMFVWHVSGPQVITVTAVTGCGVVVSVTHAITVGCGELSGVDLAGPVTATVGLSAGFTATVTPSDAAQPVTYTWEATRQISVTHEGSISDTVVFTWHITGLKAITVTSVNACGVPVSQTHTLTVEPASCIALDGVEIDGPTSGTTNTAYSFVAVITPSNATEPIAYEWTPGPNSGQGTGNSVYSWTTIGEKTVSVVVDNCSGVGVVSANHVITIGEERYVYLPVVLRN